MFEYYRDNEQQPSRVEDFQINFDNDQNSDHEPVESDPPAHLPSSNLKVTTSASIQLELANIRLRRSKYKDGKTWKLEKCKGKGKFEKYG